MTAGCATIVVPAVTLAYGNGDTPVAEGTPLVNMDVRRREVSPRPEGHVAPALATRRVGADQYRLKANPILASRDSYIGLTRSLYWLEATLIWALSQNVETPSGLGNDGFTLRLKRGKPALAPAVLAGLAEGTAKVQHFLRKSKCPAPHVDGMRRGRRHCLPPSWQCG